METWDIIIIGAGHNGLTLGCYLAGAGQKVLLLDRRGEFGGGLSTEEVTIPGFYHNLHSNFHGAMPFFPPYEDFDLEARGIRYIHPEANLALPLRDGRALVLYVDDLKSYEQICRFSKKDGEAWMQFRGQLSEHIDSLMAYGYTPPSSDTVGAEKVLRDQIIRWFGQDVMEMSAIDFVRSRFENPHVQALLAFHMAVGGWDVRLPRLGALGLGFLGYATNWQLCRGGSHHLAHVLGGAFVTAGGELREMCHVDRVIVEKGRATGVRLKDGTRIAATKAVISTVDPHQSFLDFVDASELPPGVPESARKVKYGHGDILFGAHIALSEPPRYTAAKFNPDIDRTFNVNIGYETIDDLVEHYEEIDRNELPSKPRLEASCNTLFDPSQAPPGMHTGLLWQFVPYAPGGDDPAVWDELKKEYAQRCIESWREYAPNLTPDKVLGVYAYSPHDIARKMINMRRGGFHSAAVDGDTLRGGRPIPAAGAYRTPIDRLYIGGASAYPHGGIIAAPGYNCAQVVADDLGIRAAMPFKKKFWDEARKRILAEFQQRGVRP